MKRERQRKDDKKGYVISLSEVYEVEYTKDCYCHKKGDKDLVSLPVAIKLINVGKVKKTDEIVSAATKAGCLKEIKVKNGKLI
ncbi:MAG: hypothetical protein PUB21_07885 [Bacteroidales bacterium]|nr:hypothetical protein [Bacteroidales bacterium]